MNLIFHLRLLLVSSFFFGTRRGVCDMSNEFQFAFWLRFASQRRRRRFFFYLLKFLLVAMKSAFWLDMKALFFVCFLYTSLWLGFDTFFISFGLHSSSTFTLLICLNCWRAYVWCWSCYSLNIWLWYSALSSWGGGGRKRGRGEMQIVVNYWTDKKCAKVLSNKFDCCCLLLLCFGSFHSNDKNFLLPQLAFFLSFFFLFFFPFLHFTLCNLRGFYQFLVFRRLFVLVVVGPLRLCKEKFWFFFSASSLSTPLQGKTFLTVKALQAAKKKESERQKVCADFTTNF